jgi:hypothetical protein
VKEGDAGRGRGELAMGNLVLSIVRSGGGWGGDMFVVSSHVKRLEEREHAFPLCLRFPFMFALWL